MGLFGGFKAKFTKDSTAKGSKNVKKDEVVCLGYRVYSEFDNPPQYLQNPPETRKLPSVTRTVAPGPQLATNSGEFSAFQPSTSKSTETQITSNPKVKKLSKKKTPETEKHTSAVSLTLISDNPDEQITATSATNISSPNIATITTEPVKLRNGSIKESRSAPSSVYIRGKTSSFNPNHNEISTSTSSIMKVEVATKEISPKPPKSILKSKSTIQTEDLSSQNSNITNGPDSDIILASSENIYSDNEYDTTLTMASLKTNNSNGYTTETVDYMSATQAVKENHSTRVATYVHTEVSSNSTDVTANNDYNSSSYYSGSYGYSQNTRNIGNTSNHAANIFFGGDEEPEVQRPRRANLAVLQSDEDRRSSAEC